ncbi:endoglucanase [Microbacterium terrae]|uniref:Glucanase n=1 Tax=Microbacterium terrae TaxID=69369 RepID=A0A0M2H3Z1_9MICO|nr:glycoside hydrolase family 6 protein [Microbacterium terrae]KJL39116.1 Endoglucanase A precursor [Microbacterium terrae]MBP1077729.1 endoglucanase [Microbacterium terrae]GLJ99897.1 glucanase [Microbacterium terrae]
MTSVPTSAVRPRSRRRAWLIAAVGVVAALVAVIIIIALVWPRAAAAPGPGIRVLASGTSSAAEAAAAGGGADGLRAAEYLAEQPTAVWLVPESDPLGQVAQRIDELATEARSQSARLAVVVYGLPDRDCGNHSGGGLDAAGYEEWTAEIGDALRAAADVAPIVVLEPDSLALASECVDVGERAALLSTAVDALVGPSTWLYLDGGHSNWHPAAEMAGLIEQVGDLDRVRGFALNVSNYNLTGDEVAYAHTLAAELGGERHALIDTGRNGADAGGEWCNPPGALIGEPGGTIGDDVVDTNLWIKPPGESDGLCNGGPAAGRWWPDGATSLTREVDAD